MRFFEFGKEVGTKFFFFFVWEGKGKEIIISIFGVQRNGKEKDGKKLYFWCGKKKEGKGRGKKCILVQEGNGKDEMSFPSVGRKWEGNIEIF